jgi:hypothetical protein
MRCSRCRRARRAGTRASNRASGGGDGPWSALAHVLQEQAVDAREDAKRGLLELAGRKEILMLLPLVFLILPLSVLFAIFPGIVMLRLGVG